MSLVATTFDDFKSFENSLFVDFVGFESEVQLGQFFPPRSFLIAIV